MKDERGFSIIEACLIIILCVAAGLAMYGYFKRAVQGNWRSSIDNFSDEQFDTRRSTENISPVIIKGSKIKAMVDGGGYQELPAADGGGIKSILPGVWGNYEGEADEEEQ